jgi:hypothetical protein
VLAWMDNAGVGFHEALARPRDPGNAGREISGRVRRGVPLLPCTVVCGNFPKLGLVSGLPSRPAHI